MIDEGAGPKGYLPQCVAHAGLLSLKNIRWSPDGTCLIATDYANCLDTYVVPADLLTPRDHALNLSAFCSVPSCDPVKAVACYPAFQLQDAASALLLSSLGDHPIRLSSALTGERVASYPLINPMTEEYISPHSLAFDSAGTRFMAGSDSLISIFDVSRSGQEPISCSRTGPRNSRDSRWNPAVSMRGIVSALAVDHASGILAAGTFTRQVALYDGHGHGEAIGSFTLQGNPADEAIGGGGVVQLQWSSCGRYLYVTERKSDGVMIYDIRQSGQLLSWTEGRQSRTNQRLGVDVCRNAATGECEVWAAGRDGTVRMWKDAHLQEGSVSSSFDFQAHHDPVTSAVMHPGGGVLATCSGHDYATVNNVDRANEVSQHTLHIWTI